MRGICRCCKNEYNVNADKTIRYHLTEKKECQESPDSRKCRGVGEPPQGSALNSFIPDSTEDPTGYVCRIPAGPQGCGRPVQLTANRRARSHLNNAGHPCGGGSDWPLAVDAKGNRTDTAPRGEVLPAARPEDLRMVADQDFDPRDPEGPGQAPETAAEKTSRLTREVCEVLAKRTPEQKRATAQRMDAVASEALGLPRDAELCDHEFIDHDDWDEQNGTETQVSACRHCGLVEEESEDPKPCGHPGGYGQDQYGDPACVVCGQVESVDTATRIKALPRDAELCDHEWESADIASTSGMDELANVCKHCGLVEEETEDPQDVEPPDWRTPPDLLAQMPEDVQALARTNPECWDCGHEVIPLVDRFGLNGEPEAIVWSCQESCGWARRGGHSGKPCRPRSPAQDRLGNLDTGVLFRRHVTRGDGLVYRVQSRDPAAQLIRVTVISAGPHAGRTGELTNLQEEITCTDLDGNPRPRRDPHPTPSAPSKTPSPTPGPSSVPSTTASASSAKSRSARTTSSGASARETTSTPTATTTGAQVPDAFSTPKAAIKESEKYDNYGRYKLLHPKTGKPVKWTRATTYAKSISDTYALSQWSQRMTLKGAALRPDVVAAASTLEVKADKDRMNGLVDEAKKAAGDKVAANKGTAVHAFTEDRDKILVGIPVKDRQVPEEYQATVDAYESVLQAFGLEPVPGLIEFTTAVLQYEIAGTSDRVYLVTRDITLKLNGRSVTLYAGEYVVGDVKTGADLSYGMQEIAIQLAIYAQGLNTSGVWDWGTRRWSFPSYLDKNGQEVRIQVRTDVGIIPHLPVDRSETKAPLATLYAVDLSAGWAATVLCGQVRSWRKERTLATPLEIADVVADRTVPVQVHSVSASRPATLEDKARAVTSRAEASAVFQEATGARVSRAELDRLVGLMQTKLTSHVEQGA